MRISEYFLWLLVTFGSLFIVSAVLPEKWSAKAKTVFRITVTVSFFFLVGVYWLATGERPDETAYRFVLCKIYQFERCNHPESLDAKGGNRRQIEKDVQPTAAEIQDREENAERRRRDELERQRTADEARKRAAEAERQFQSERERQRLIDEARERAAEAERRLQEERERQRLVDEARARTAEAERRRLQEERERQLRVEEERQRELEAERQRQVERERELRSRRYGATAVGRNDATGGLRAISYVNGASTSEVESRALAECNRVALDCKIVARFSGPGKCVYVAGGTTITREVGRTRRQVGARVAGTEGEAFQKCRSDFASCSIFHSRCNSI